MTIHARAIADAHRAHRPATGRGRRRRWGSSTTLCQNRTRRYQKRQRQRYEKDAHASFPFDCAPLACGVKRYCTRATGWVKLSRTALCGKDTRPGALPPWRWGRSRRPDDATQPRSTNTAPQYADAIGRDQVHAAVLVSRGRTGGASISRGGSFNYGRIVAR